MTNLLDFTLTDINKIRRSDLYGKKLSERELQVIKLMCKGMSRKEIAKELIVSPHTIRNHLVSIFGKLNVSDNLKVVIVYLNDEIPENMIPDLSD